MADSIKSSSAKSMKTSSGSGKSSVSRIFQFNKMLDEYSFFSDKFFKIRLQAFETPSMAIASKKQEITNEAKSTEPIVDMELLYSGSTFTNSHSHSWGQSRKGIIGNKLPDQADISNLQSVLEGGWGMIAGAATLDAKKITDAFTQTLGNSIANSKYSTLEFANSYERSEPMRFTITTTFIAYDDPLTDVVIPCKMLEYIGYPTITTNTKLLDAFKQIGASTSAGVGSVDIALPKAITDLAEQAKQSNINATTGIFNSRFGKVPPTWNVTFSNGLHGLSTCALVGVNVVYYGPWLAQPSPFEIERNIERLNAGTDYDFTSLASYLYKHGEKLAPEAVNYENGRRCGYPSYAEVTLEFKDTFSTPFGEDVIKGMYGGIEDKISVSSGTKK